MDKTLSAYLRQETRLPYDEYDSLPDHQIQEEIRVLAARLAQAAPAPANTSADPPRGFTVDLRKQTIAWDGQT
jgi:hypothetical protein